MSPIVRNLILSLGFAAVIVGVLKGLVALPVAMHNAGIDAPVIWIEARQ